MWSAIQSHPQVMLDVFVKPKEHLAVAASVIVDMYKVNWSPEGSTRKAQETKAVSYWRDFVLECEGKLISLYFSSPYLNYTLVLMQHLIRKQLQVIVLSAQSQCHTVYVVEQGKIEDLLVFLTGSNEVPMFGFDRQAHITFPHQLALDDQTAEFPVVNTCALHVRLPLLNTYRKFRENFLSALQFGIFTME